MINFYIKHDTPYQEDVINPSTILWMLKIIDTHKEDQDLCLLAAKTVLKVVNNHQIVFDYQEMAIIKKFNKALDNIGGAMKDVHPATDTLHTTPAPASEVADMALALDQRKATTPASAAEEEQKESLFKRQAIEKEIASAGEPSIEVKSPVSVKRLMTQTPDRVDQVSEKQRSEEQSFDSDKFQEEIEKFSKHSGQDDDGGKDLLEESARSLKQLQSSIQLDKLESEAIQRAEEEISKRN